MFENFTLFDAMSAVQVWTLTLYMSAMLREIHRRLWTLVWTAALLHTQEPEQPHSMYLLCSLRRNYAGLWTRPYARRCVYERATPHCSLTRKLQDGLASRPLVVSDSLYLSVLF